MKRIVTLFSVIFALMLVVACGNKPATGEQVKDGKTSADSTNSKKAVAVVYSTGGKGDKSFNDATFRGLQKAQKELGITFKEYEPKDPATEAKNALTQFAESGEFDLIIAVGYTMKDSLVAVAQTFPDQKFAIIDETVNGLPNVASILFKEQEGSFLVGALAGMMDKTGTIGFVGANESELINRFYAGYEQGAKYIKPGIKVLPVYIGGNNAFNDQASAKAKTETLVQQGADIIYHAAGASGLGVFQAVKEKNIYGIGVDSDQDGLYPGTILTSMLKYVDNATFDVIKAAVDGKFEAKLQTFGIKENGVGTTNFEFTKDKIGEENLKKLEQIKQDIKDGKIVVKASR
ncbi:BMP family lipoprotein [Leptotrichia buccalis]|uniref:Basic membrane lipoprotein n=1 Tax=Leptotrichia buccalis (strain ATCC 14201 / DSM 1135 / JCM 12969 / NCTC 10249 / C-1013-b) TaxID=523794 RepID=C7N964_LEPBD|nr:BMP family ABC transporter substrate-binding protein [Leptotrichia buccalis]ACV38695.1 basic membrane lipoprotein [Leptotrichia buccalis C-1013-b]